MGTLHFAVVAAGLFVLAFVGISWSNKGFPVVTMRAEPMKPQARSPIAEDSEKKAIRKVGESFKPAPGDGDPLRLATLQAANALVVAPCDATMKENLIAALSAYARAWTEMAGCKFGVCGGDDSTIDTAAAKFSTPADMRVREAVRGAFDTASISREDFSGSMRLWVTMLAGDPGDPVSACAAGRRAENRR